MAVSAGLQYLWPYNHSRVACREQELEASRLVFRVALNTTLAASIDLQQAIAQLDVPELNVHIQQGKKLLKETHVALSYLVSAVRLSTVSQVSNLHSFA